jgi:hypothetical protein
MGQLGREIAKARAQAASAVGGLAIMEQRGHGSLTMISIEAEKLERAAKILREAIHDAPQKI